MKTAVISQRVDEVRDYDEIRDALDEQWHKLFLRMDTALVPVPNMPETVENTLIRIHPDAIVLSGGNTPAAYGGTAAQRDRVDELLIRYALEHNVPLLGVCRGMQSVVLYFGGTLKKAEGHVAVSHKLVGEIRRTVNSYHGYCVDQPGEELQVIARTEQGSIEAVRHVCYPVYGIMWHPERVEGFDDADLVWIQEKLHLKEEQ